MIDLCVNCDHMDEASKARWDRSVKRYEDVAGLETETFPEFDTWKPHCMKHKRQPVTDSVAGTHLDGPPYLRCYEVRKTCPVTCRDYEERTTE